MIRETCFPSGATISRLPLNRRDPFDSFPRDFVTLILQLLVACLTKKESVRLVSHISSIDRKRHLRDTSFYLCILQKLVVCIFFRF